MATVEKLRGIPAWQAECERAAFNAGALLRLADRHVTAAAVLEVLRTVPRSPHEQVFRDDGAYMRCAVAANELCPSYKEELRQSVMGYFHRYATMNRRRRAFIEASIAGALVGWGMGG